MTFCNLTAHTLSRLDPRPAPFLALFPCLACGRLGVGATGREEMWLGGESGYEHRVSCSEVLWEATCLS